MALATDTRARGPQEPQKYPVQVGTTYLYYGEQPGYIYNPYNDSYVPDPRLATDYFQQAGLAGNPEGIPPNAKPGGRKEPGKYPGTGPNYDRYGEIPGWQYDYLTDTYIPPAPKETSVLETYGPVAGTGLAIGVGTGLAQDPTGFLGDIKDGVTGLFGLGSAGSAAAPAATAAPAAATTAGAAAAPAAAGTFGLAAPAAPSVASVGMAAPAVPEVVGGTAAAAPGGMFGLAGASPFLTAAGIGLGAHMGVQSFEGINKIIDNEELSLQEQISMAPWTFGASFAYNPIRDFFGGDGDKWKEEGNRLRDLAEDGTFIPDNILASMPDRGRSQDELENKSVASDFMGFDPSGNWTNNKFNQSRDLKDLRPEDIVGYAAFAEKDPLWFEKPLQERLDLANVALQAGAVSEHNGTIDVDWDKFDPGAAPGSYSGYAGNPSLAPKPAAPVAAPAGPAQTPMQPRPYIPTPEKPQAQPAQSGTKNPFWMFQQGALRR